MSSEPAEPTEFWYGSMPTNPPTTCLPSEWESWEIVLEAATNEKLHLEKIESTRAPCYRCTSRPQTHPSSPPRSRLDPPFLRTYAHTTIGFRTHEDPTAAPRCWLHLFSDKTIITTGQSVRFRAKSTHHRPSRIALVHLFASSSSDLLQMTPLLVTVVPLVKGQANEIV
uniref:Putative tryptophan 2,3-dioxygenase n=1 Tax=Moniliophthora roreri TaxID=221103 RepID=A0A0W0G8Z9_MONRR